MSSLPEPPEPWLRGPVAGVPPALQPVAHAFIMALEDTTLAATGLSPAQIWARPGEAASVGFHLMHLSGSTDRLLTYARGEKLSDPQRAALALEQAPGDSLPSLVTLQDAWNATVARALVQLKNTSDATLGEARFVGRAHLPSTTLGLLFHAAEHAARHTGQLVTTAKIVRATVP